MNVKRKLFISFRNSDGDDLRKEITKLLTNEEIIIDKSEHVDREGLQDETIQKYLYEKLKDSSITLVLLTFDAVNYRRDTNGRIDDWLYDELRYSLSDREYNRRNGVVAVYTNDAKDSIYEEVDHSCHICNETKKINQIKKFDNLVRDNMLNVKLKYKKNKCDNVYDGLQDSYISIVSLENFINDPQKYIDNAFDKRGKTEQYNIKVNKE